MRCSRSRGRHRLHLYVMLTLACAGCGGYAVQLIGTSDQNRGTTGPNTGPNPVRLNIYQLSARDNFDRSTSAALWRDDASVLKDQMIAKEQVQLFPDEKRDVKLKLSEKTKFIAVAADFISPDAEKWKQVQALADGKKVRITVGARELQIE